MNKAQSFVILLVIRKRTKKLCWKGLKMKNNKLVIMVLSFNEDNLIEYSVNELLMFLDAIINDGLVSAESKIVFINDGSCDKNVDIILSYCKNHERVELINLNKNYEQQCAIFTGLYMINADIYVTIDVDLTEDFLLIIEMIEKFYEGYDVIFDCCNNCKPYSFLRKYAAKIFYKFINFKGIKIRENPFKTILLSRNAVERINEYKGEAISLREIIQYLGLKSCNIYSDKSLRLTEKQNNILV